MLGVERLGRASSPLSACLGAAAPEEIKKCPGTVVVVVVLVVVDGDKLCLASEKTRGRKSTSNRLKTLPLERVWKLKKNKTSDFLFSK